MITVTPTESDLIAAIWIRRKRLFTGKMGWFTWLGIACALATGVLLIFLGPRYGIGASIGYWLLGIYVYVISMVGVVFLLTPVKVKRIFRKAKLVELSYTLDWNDQNMVTESKNSKTSLPWQEFTRWFEDRRIFMLYRRGIVTTFVPKRVLNEEQLKDLRRVLVQQVGPEGVARK